MTLDIVLDRLAANIFVQPYASPGKDSRGVFAPARRVSKSYALGMPTIQLNGPRQKRYLAFDIDRPLGALAWEDANLPIPNLIITNPKNGHAHLVYELRDPVWERRSDDVGRGEALPVRYYRAVSRAMQEALQADPAYNGLLVKNPFHPNWTVTCGRQNPYTLEELSRHLELTRHQETRLWQNGNGRNCTLFDSIRLWAYRAKQQYNDVQRFSSAIDIELDHLNEKLDNPLSLRELHGIGKSVSHWVWNSYHGNGHSVRRGICHADPTLELSLRQQQGQAFSSRVRVNQTLTKMRLAIESLRKQAVKLTKAAIAKVSGISRSTVYRHWSVFFPSQTVIAPAILAPVTQTVTERETVSLRDQSPEPPAEAAAPEGGVGYPDSHSTRHTKLSRLLAYLGIERAPPVEPSRPSPTSVLEVRRAIDKYYEQSNRRTQ